MQLLLLIHNYSNTNYLVHVTNLFNIEILFCKQPMTPQQMLKIQLMLSIYVLEIGISHERTHTNK
jgi:hypothetical protein